MDLREVVATAEQPRTVNDRMQHLPAVIDPLLNAVAVRLVECGVLGEGHNDGAVVTTAAHTTPTTTPTDS